MSNKLYLSGLKDMVLEELEHAKDLDAVSVRERLATSGPKQTASLLFSMRIKAHAPLRVLSAAEVRYMSDYLAGLANKRFTGKLAGQLELDVRKDKDMLNGPGRGIIRDHSAKLSSVYASTMHRILMG